MTGDLICFNFSFFELLPKYECKNAENGNWTTCLPKEFCGTDTEYRIDWSDPESIDNWVELLNLACESQTHLGVLGSGYFAGYAISCLILPRLSDIFGRKKIFWSALAVQLGGFIGVMLSDSMVATFWLIFLFGICGAGRSTVGFLYTMELMQKEVKVLTGTLINMSESLVLFFSALYFWQISKHLSYLMIFGFIINSILVGLLYFIPESPEYLHSIKKYEQCRNQLRWIAKVNQLTISDKLFQDVLFEEEKLEVDNSLRIHDAPNPDVQQSDEIQLSGSIIELFTTKRLVINMGVMALILIALSFNYFLITFNLKYLPGNIFINSMVASLFEIVFLSISMITFNKLGIKRTLMLGFVISLIGSFPLIIYYSQLGDFSTSFFLLFCKGGILFNISISFITFSMLFPPMFSQTAFGITKFFGRLATIAAPIAAELSEPTPLVVFTILCVFASVSIFFIQLKKKALKEVELTQIEVAEKQCNQETDNLSAQIVKDEI